MEIMKNRYYDINKKGQAVYEGSNPPSHLIKDDDERVKNFFEPTPEGHRKTYTVEGLPFNELIPPAPAPTQEELDEQFNLGIDKQIENLERKNARAVRELILNPSDTVARGLVQKADDDIKILRDKRK
jgi:hypothetical protein